MGTLAWRSGLEPDSADCPTAWWRAAAKVAAWVGRQRLGGLSSIGRVSTTCRGNNPDPHGCTGKQVPHPHRPVEARSHRQRPQPGVHGVYGAHTIRVTGQRPTRGPPFHRVQHSDRAVLFGGERHDPLLQRQGPRSGPGADSYRVPGADPAALRPAITRCRPPRPPGGKSARGNHADLADRRRRCATSRPHGARDWRCGAAQTSKDGAAPHV